MLAAMLVAALLGLDTALELARNKPRTGSWRNLTSWRVLPEPPGGCPADGAYVCILSGPSQMENVLCLNRQLRRWRPSCPLLVFYDDHPAKQLPADVLARLASELGEANVRSVSWLHAQANFSVGYASYNRTAGVATASPAEGRLLLEQVGEYLFWGTLTKVCLFVLKRYSRLVFLDLDVVLLRPLDALMAMPMPADTYVAAVGTGGACPRVVAWEPFNGGIEVLRPSRSHFDQMMRRLCRFYMSPAHQDQNGAALFTQVCLQWGGRTTGFSGSLRAYYKVCERFLTDQSLFNLQARPLNEHPPRARLQQTIPGASRVRDYL